MHRRSRHVYSLVALLALALLVWGLVRVTLCWGEYGYLGIVLCHSHLIAYLALLAAVYVLYRFLMDLASSARLRPQAQSLSTVRAVREGFKLLEASERRHAVASALLVAAFLLLILWLLFLSPIRF